MKKIALYQQKKQVIDSGLERVERIQKQALKRLGLLLSRQKAAKIALDLTLKEAREAESHSIRKGKRQDSLYNEASRLYGIAESISRSYGI